MKSPIRARKIRILDRKLGNLIEIDPRQRSRDRLDTVCHEVIHLLGPHLSEEIVISHANILSDALWRDRWRRLES